MKKIFAAGYICFFLSSIVFAGPAEQFGRKPKNPGQDPYKQYVFCVEMSMEKGMSQEDAEKNCDQILDGSKGFGLKGDSRGARDSRSIVAYRDNGEVYTVNSSSYKGALNLIKNSEIKITKDGVIWAGGLIATASVLWKGAKLLSPIGAFFAALGVGPAAAADYCSRFQGQKGLLLYFSFDIGTQMAEADKCPELVDRIIEIDRAIRANTYPNPNDEQLESSI